MDLTLERSSSVDSSGSRESFNSDDLNENEYFDFAPYDIYDESQILGKILVASKCDALPKVQSSPYVFWHDLLKMTTERYLATT